MEELVKKMDEFNKNFRLQEEAQALHAQLIRKLADEHPEIRELDQSINDQAESAGCFNKVAHWFAGNKQGLPLTLDGIFSELVNLNILSRGSTKAENVERYLKCFNNIGGEEVKEFTAFYKKLIKDLDPFLNNLEKVGAATIKLSFDALELLEKDHGIKPITKAEFDVRQKSNKIHSIKRKKNKRK